MRVATIRITDRNEIELEEGGLSPAELVTGLDALINVICERATGNPIKGQQMKRIVRTKTCRPKAD